MENVIFILKIRFNNDKLTSRAKRIKTFHTVKQNGALELVVRSEYSHCLYRKGRQENQILESTLKLCL